MRAAEINSTNHDLAAPEYLQEALAKSKELLMRYKPLGGVKTKGWHKIDKVESLEWSILPVGLLPGRKMPDLDLPDFYMDADRLALNGGFVKVIHAPQAEQPKEIFETQSEPEEEMPNVQSENDGELILF